MRKPLIYFISPLLLGLAQTGSAGDLIAWWNFDTDGGALSIDVQAGNAGLLLSGAQYTPAGGGRTGTGSDRGMLFGNDRHRLHVPDGSFLNVLGATNKVTVSFWQNLQEVRNQSTFFAVSPSSAITRGLATHSPWSDGGIYWDGSGCCDGSNRISSNPGATWISTWNHIVLVKDGDTKFIYVNGVEIATGENTSPLASDFTELFIGNSSNQAEAVNGVLDDFAIYQRALTPEEVALLYAGDTPGSLDGPNDVDGDGLADAWELRFAATLAVMAPGGDLDSDGLSNASEFASGTKPDNNDTDGDGALDGAETGTGVWVSASNTGTNRLVADTDGDGIKDGAETKTGAFVNASNTGTNPLVVDSDGDGFSDGAEALYSSSNPNNAASRPLRPGQTDLVAYWNFDDDTDPAKTLDQVKSFPGTLKPNTLFTADGTGRTGLAGDKAIDMGASGNSGTGVVVEGGGFLNIGAAQDQVAISWWQNLSGTPDSSSMYAQSNSMERGINVHTPWSNGNIYFDTAGCCDGGTQRIDVAGGLTPGVWEHIVVNKNGTTKAIWVNGVKIKEGVNTSALPTNFTRFLMGTDGGNLNMAGLIDDVAVYGDALTDAEIALLFAGTKPNDASIVPPNADADGDGMQDAYEVANGLNKNLDDRFLDLDGDTIDNITEYLGGTLPNKADTDSDGLSDGAETKTGLWVSALNTGTDPVKVDSDGDSLSDGVESNTGIFVSLSNTGTNPNKSDSDGDKWPDLAEIQWPSDPNVKTSVPLMNPAKLDLLAFWDFNDNANPTLAKDSQHGFEAKFLGTTLHSEAAEGRTGVGADRAMNLGGAGGTNGARVEAAKWFGLGIPPVKQIANLGSLGTDGNMLIGSGVVDVPGALPGSTDTAINLPKILNTVVPYDKALNPAGAWTAEVWLNPAESMGAGALTCAISCGDFAAPRKGWLIYQSDTGWNLRTYYNDGLAAAVNITGNNGAPPVPGVWTHVVVKWDGTLGTVYVDGVPRATSAVKPYVPGAGGNFSVGSRADVGFPWNGDADEVAFYNTALSDEVIKAHFDNGVNAAPATPYSNLVLTSAPVGYWRMTDSTPGEVTQPDQVAVSFWEKLDAISDSSAFWASSASSGGSNRGFQAHAPWSSGDIYFDSAGCCNGGSQRINGPGDVQVGEWTHFVFQKNGGTKEVWKNGVLVLSGEGADRIPNDFTHLVIGADGNGVSATRGMIDDFAVFGESLTEEQIMQLASGASPTSINTGAFAITSMKLNQETQEVTLKWNSLPGKTYTLQASTNLGQTWSYEIDDNIASGGNGSTYVHSLLSTFPAGAPTKLFYRIRQNP